MKPPPRDYPRELDAAYAENQRLTETLIQCERRIADLEYALSRRIVSVPMVGRVA